VLAAIAATAGRDCDYRYAAREQSNAQPAIAIASFAIRSTRDSHTDDDVFAFPLRFRREQAVLLARSSQSRA
jgi:hypothetical protein